MHETEQTMLTWCFGPLLNAPADKPKPRHETCAHLVHLFHCQVAIRDVYLLAHIRELGTVESDRQILPRQQGKHVALAIFPEEAAAGSVLAKIQPAHIGFMSTLEVY